MRRTKSRSTVDGCGCSRCGNSRCMARPHVNDGDQRFVSNNTLTAQTLRGRSMATITSMRPPIASCHVRPQIQGATLDVGVPSLRPQAATCPVTGGSIHAAGGRLFLPAGVIEPAAVGSPRRRAATGGASRSVCREGSDRQVDVHQGILDREPSEDRGSERCSVRTRPTTVDVSRDTLPQGSSRPSTTLPASAQAWAGGFR